MKVKEERTVTVVKKTTISMTVAEFRRLLGVPDNATLVVHCDMDGRAYDYEHALDASWEVSSEEYSDPEERDYSPQPAAGGENGG